MSRDESEFGKAMKVASAISKKYFDGHFIFMAFTTNYRCTFERDYYMGENMDVVMRQAPSGATPIEAVRNAYIEVCETPLDNDEEYIPFNQFLNGLEKLKERYDQR